MTKSAHHIVFSSEKDGAGTSTVAAHVAVGLLRIGYKVASFDLDASKNTLTKYMTTRFSSGSDLPRPDHVSLQADRPKGLTENDFIKSVLLSHRTTADFIVIDTPSLSPPPLTLAHTLVTVTTYAISSGYTAQVKAASPQTWIGLLNRHPALEGLERMTTADGCTIVLGLAEREMIPLLMEKGLTLLDLKQDGTSALDMSALTARQEVRLLLRALNPQQLRGYPRHRGRDKR